MTSFKEARPLFYWMAGGKRLIYCLILVMLFQAGCSGLGGVETPHPRPSRFDRGTWMARNAQLPCPAAGLDIALPPFLTEDRPEFSPYLAHYRNERGRTSLERGLERGAQYLPKMEKIFQGYGLPLELLHLALIESSFRPDARSHRGAVGMWQFMKSTARLYGLKVGRKVDERKDVLKATDAAARFLRDLYAQFGDWYLAVAAYNAGAGSVQRAIKRAGSADFFKIAERRYLRKESINFVLRFVAITRVATELYVPRFSDTAFAAMQPVSGFAPFLGDSPAGVLP